MDRFLLEMCKHFLLVLGDYCLPVICEYLLSVAWCSNTCCQGRTVQILASHAVLFLNASATELFSVSAAGMFVPTAMWILAANAAEMFAASASEIIAASSIYVCCQCRDNAYCQCYVDACCQHATGLLCQCCWMPTATTAGMLNARAAGCLLPMLQEWCCKCCITTSCQWYVNTNCTWCIKICQRYVEKHHHFLLNTYFQCFMNTGWHLCVLAEPDGSLWVRSFIFSEQLKRGRAICYCLPDETCQDL